MTTLLVGNELIFASSAKGPKNPYDRDSQVQGDLTVCKDANEGRLHKNGGRCGEVMAFHDWYESHVRSGPLEPTEGTKIVAISFQKNADGEDEPLIMAPCGNDVCTCLHVSKQSTTLGKVLTERPETMGLQQVCKRHLRTG